MAQPEEPGERRQGPQIAGPRATLGEMEGRLRDPLDPPRTREQPGQPRRVVGEQGRETRTIGVEPATGADLEIGEAKHVEAVGIELAEHRLRGEAEAGEDSVQHLPRSTGADIMEARIELEAVAAERAEESADLLGLFEGEDVEAVPREVGGRGEAAGAGADDDGAWC